MEYESTGKLIQKLRKAKGLTQKQLADMLNITDKAVSKWERNITYPDTTTLPKLSEILGTNVETLLNSKCNTIEENKGSRYDSNINSNAETYAERVRHLLKTGAWGFVIGFVLFALMLFSSTSTHYDWITLIRLILISFVCGIAFAGIPYGWNLINNFLNKWNVFCSIYAMIFLFCFKLIASYAIGLTFYPFVLLYNFVRSQKTKRKVKIWAMVSIITIVIIYSIVIFSIIYNHQ